MRGEQWTRKRARTAAAAKNRRRITLKQVDEAANQFTPVSVAVRKTMSILIGPGLLVGNAICKSLFHCRDTDPKSRVSLPGSARDEQE